MKPQAILVVTLAVVAVIAALAPLGEGYSWPCCDNCGACNRKEPPECSCNDVMVNGCHPECKKCTKIGGGIRPGMGPGPVIIYRCDDILTNFCQNNCTVAA